MRVCGSSLVILGRVELPVESAGKMAVRYCDELWRLQQFSPGCKTQGVDSILRPFENQS
jgi:hypothetical protein